MRVLSNDNTLILSFSVHPYRGLLVFVSLWPRTQRGIFSFCWWRWASLVVGRRFSSSFLCFIRFFIRGMFPKVFVTLQMGALLWFIVAGLLSLSLCHAARCFGLSYLLYFSVAFGSASKMLCAKTLSFLWFLVFIFFSRVADASMFLQNSSLHLFKRPRRQTVVETSEVGSRLPCSCSKFERLFAFLENRHTAMCRGFDSHSLRQTLTASKLAGLLAFYLPKTAVKGRCLST